MSQAFPKAPRRSRRMGPGTRLALPWALLLVAACGEPTGEDIAAPPGPALQLANLVDDLRAASCPPDRDHRPLPPIPLASTPVALRDVDPAADLPGARFAGGWHLESRDPAFGGLSGLAWDATEERLLAVTDRGAFVALELEDGRPARARLAPMAFADATGAAATAAAATAADGKAGRDAEGLALHESLALVSFEHRHEVLAFALADCGAAARGVSVAAFTAAVAGLARPLDANGGAEGLAVGSDGSVLLALETQDGGLPLARLSADGEAQVIGRIAPRGRPVLTGIERAGETLYAVLRDYLPGIGNTIEVIALPTGAAGPDTGAAQRVLRLAPRHGTDNFEGIALAPGKGGGLRLWLVADDNFSKRQRTLLYAFDLPATPEDADAQPSP